MELHRGRLIVLDPDGNNIEAVYHGRAARSSASVRIKVGR